MFYLQGYEAPAMPDIVVKTAEGEGPEESAKAILDMVKSRTEGAQAT